MLRIWNAPAALTASGIADLIEELAKRERDLRQVVHNNDEQSTSLLDFAATRARKSLPNRMEPICPLSEAYCSRTASAEGISAPGLTVSVHSQYQRAAIRFSSQHTFPISLSQSDGSQGETVSRHKYRETSRTEVTDWSTVSAIRERPSVATWALCEPSTPVIRAAQPARLSKGVQLCRRLRLRAIPMKLVLNVTVARPDLGRLAPVISWKEPSAHDLDKWTSVTVKWEESAKNAE